MEMTSLGRKYGGEMVSAKTQENQISYPEVTITEEVLPGLKGKTVKDTVKLTIEAEVCSVSQYGNGDTDYRLKLKKAGIEGKKDTQE